MLLKTLESRRSGWELYPSLWSCVLAGVLACASGCGPEGALSGEGEAWETSSRALTVDNGLSLNGLSLNGLSLNGLSTSDFSSWFLADVTTRDEVMRYLVGCAVPSGESRSVTLSGTTYTWNGELGLAPGWASGSAATLAELQVVSACMAAHANKYGVHITISLRGLDGAGHPIATTSQELTDYTVHEACFFGNLFDGSTGTFGGNDGLSLSSTQSSPRVCGLPGAPNTTQCPPLVYVGNCADSCTQDATHSYYTSCTFNGVTYRPVTTRMKPADIYSCGDGVCQVTEHCGSGTTPDSCEADCGPCP